MHEEYELIKPKTKKVLVLDTKKNICHEIDEIVVVKATSIRKRLNNSTWDPYDKAVSKGADAVREYFNRGNMRLREKRKKEYMTVLTQKQRLAQGYPN